MTAPTPAPEYGELIERLEAMSAYSRIYSAEHKDIAEAARAIRDLEAENARKDALLRMIAVASQGGPLPGSLRTALANVNAHVAEMNARAALSGRGRG